MNFRKMKRNFRRNQKAISPVIATLLMIAIAVVASLVTYAWVMGYMGFTTNKVGKSILIQSATYNTNASTPSGFTLYVQNIGDSDVKFGANNYVFVNGAAQTADAAQKTIKVGNTLPIVITGVTGLPAGVNTLNFKVVTEDGTPAELTKQFTLYLTP
jgi:archaeal type IV pilus assembly protein PilA